MPNDRNMRIQCLNNVSFVAAVDPVITGEDERHLEEEEEEEEEDNDEDEDEDEDDEEEEDEDDERTIIMEVEDELSNEHVKEAKVKAEEEEPAFNIPDEDEDDKEEDASVLAAFAKHKQPAAAGRSKQAK